MGNLQTARSLLDGLLWISAADKEDGKIGMIFFPASARINQLAWPQDSNQCFQIQMYLRVDGATWAGCLFLLLPGEHEA